jgi:Polyketide cyclase / dehydrase and lipid transport
MLKTIALAVAAIVAATLIYAATKPDNFTLSRSATIAASPEKVFTLISDLKSFNTWNPFAKQDPKVKIDYEGAARGIGAVHTLAERRLYRGHMDHERVDDLLAQADDDIRQHGQDGRLAVRGRSGRTQGRRRARLTTPTPLTALPTLSAHRLQHSSQLSGIT